MVYQSQKMNLECLQIVKKSRVNDICVCRDLSTAAGNLYTLLMIKEHQVAKAYLEVFEQAGMSAQDSYIHNFSEQGVFCMAFEYKQERPLSKFYAGGSYTLAECETICENLIMTCMMSNLPYPILYLILKQGQINLARDHSVYLGYGIDLTELDTKKTERDCAVQCASIIRELLSSKKAQKAFSYRLLEKKISRKSYDRFTELYKDIRITAAPKKEKGIRRKLMRLWNKNQDTVFRILLVICVVLAVLAAVSLICQLVFGDIPWLRIFFNGFKVIGTESLV